MNALKSGFVNQTIRSFRPAREIVQGDFPWIFFLLLDNIPAAKIEMNEEAHSMGEAIRIEILRRAAERLVAAESGNLSSDEWWRNRLRVLRSNLSEDEAGLGKTVLP
jgi:hypothetical protein